MTSPADLIIARLADGIPTVNDKGESTLLYLPGLRPHPNQPPEVAQVVTATLELIADAIVAALETEYVITAKAEYFELSKAAFAKAPCSAFVMSTGNGDDVVEIDMNPIAGQDGGVDYD